MLIAVRISDVFSLNWLGGVPPLVVDLATFSLAALGGLVAVNPPEKESARLRWFYVTCFIFLAGVAVGANLWQRNLEGKKQDQLQQNETDARNQFAVALRSVQKSNGLILNFVANPPKGVTEDQIRSIVRGFTEQQRLASPGMSRDVLRIISLATLQEMRQVNQMWGNEDNAILYKTSMKAIDDKERPSPQGDADLRDLIRQRENLNNIYSERIEPTMRNASLIQEELLEGQTKTDEDKKFEAMFVKILAGQPIIWGEMSQITGYMTKLITKNFPS